MTSLIPAAIAAQRLVAEELRASGDEQILCRGSGDAIVCLPTFAELNFVYAPLADALSRSWRVVLYAPRVSYVSPFGPAERATELMAVLDRLGVARAHLVAWSDAGAVVSEFSRRAPDRVLSRVYLGTPAAYVMPRGLRLMSAIYARSGLYRFTPDRLAALLIALLMGSPAMPSRQLYRRIRALGPVAGYLRFSILPCLRYPNRAAGDCATLVVGGDADRFVPLDEIRRLAEQPGADFAYVRGADHFLPWTKASEVTATVSAFLDRVRRPT